jgi:hypothetical protein
MESGISPSSAISYPQTLKLPKSKSKKMEESSMVLDYDDLCKIKLPL